MFVYQTPAATPAARQFCPPCRDGPQPGKSGRPSLCAGRLRLCLAGLGYVLCSFFLYCRLPRSSNVGLRPSTAYPSSLPSRSIMHSSMQSRHSSNPGSHPTAAWVAPPAMEVLSALACRQGEVGAPPYLPTPTMCARLPWHWSVMPTPCLPSGAGGQSLSLLVCLSTWSEVGRGICLGRGVRLTKAGDFLQIFGGCATCGCGNPSLGHVPPVARAFAVDSDGSEVRRGVLYKLPSCR